MEGRVNTSSSSHINHLHALKAANLRMTKPTTVTVAKIKG